MNYQGNQSPHLLNQLKKPKVPLFISSQSRPTFLKIETDIKILRETGSTICMTPKNKQSLQLTDFLLLKILGKGRFGSVYLAIHKQTGFILAIKVVSKGILTTQNEEQSRKLLNQLIRQIKIQMFLEHPNLISLYSFFHDNQNVYLLMEVGCGGQLYELMKKKKSFSEQATSFLIREILKGLDYMHSNSVIHRDIKPENIVLQHGVPKICDFGWSVYCSNQFRSTLCGTPLYLSPQILKGDGYNEKIDTWAIGTLTHEIFIGNSPFSIKRKSQIIRIIQNKPDRIDGSTVIKEFVESCLSKDPKNRPEANQLLKYALIRKYLQLQTCQQICCHMKPFQGLEKIKMSRNKF